MTQSNPSDNIKSDSRKLKRDITATLVPFGSPIFLTAGTQIIITQALGGSYTAIFDGQMLRIDFKDADALGEKPQNDAIADNPNLSLDEKVWAKLRTCYDPEIPVNIVDLGLIYGVEVKPTEPEKDQFQVLIRMTLTAPGCGMGPMLAEEAKDKVKSLPSVKDVAIEIVFDPPWDRSMMSDQAKLELGMM